jgi:hypothetical protein
MTPLEILQRHVGNLEKPSVRFGDHPEYNSINLVRLLHDCTDFENFGEWMQSKNLTPHLRKHIIIAILGTDPPEEAKLEILMHSL